MNPSSNFAAKSEDFLEHGLLSTINAIDVVSSLSESADPLDALIDHEYQSNFKPEVDEIEDLKDVVEVKKDVSNIAIQDTTVSLEAIQAKLSANEISIPLNLSESAIISATVPKVPNLFEISNSARFEGVLPSTQGHPSPSGTTSYNAYDAQTMSYGQGQQQYYSNSQPNTARSDIIQQPPLTSRVNIAPTTYPEDLSSLSIHEFYGKFWEISFKLFSNVCSPYISCHDCLTVVEDLIALVHKWGQLRSPSLIIALDVVIQRAMYELSDKMCKVRSSEEQSELAEKILTTDDSMQNIEECVGIMSHFALPLCWNVQNEFNLGFLAEGSHTLGSKMQTLNRQLQELVAWTSMVGQSKVPSTFIDELKANPADFGGIMRLDSPRSQATLEMLDHTLLSLLVETVGNQTVSPELMDSVQSTLVGIVSRQMGTMVDVQTCGAYALGTIFSENGPELDFVAITAGTMNQVTNWKKLEEGGIPSTSRGSICRQYERIVEIDLLAEGAIKHVKACVKDFLSATGETLHALRTYLAANRNEFHHGHYGHAQSMQQQHQHYMHMLNDLIEEDMNTIRMAGDYFLEKFETTKLGRMRSYPALPIIISKIEILQDSIEKEEKEKNAYLRKAAKALEKPIRDVGFANVRCMTTRARFIHLSFVTYDNRLRHNVPCTMVLDNELPIQGTLLLREYMRFDRSGKIRGFLTIVKKFVKCHNIADVNNGFLSMFAWYMMALHVLLKFDYIPNIHRHGLTLDESPYAAEYNAFANAKINSTYLMELLDRFFRYYVEEFDTFTGVVSIQGQGEILHKMNWQKTPVLWRISVEDPFAPLSSRNGYDLGTTLSRPGQLTTFKALRRAVYGIRSIVAMGMDSTRANMKKFFSRAELIHLARRSDYIGATISQPRPWTRRSTSTSLFSLKNLQDQLSNDKLVAISQLNLEDSIMMSPRESMLRSSAAPFPNPSNYPGLSATSMIGGNGSFSARKEESYDPRYQNYGRTPVNTAASVGMNMGSFIDQAPGGGYSRYHGENLNQGFTGAPSPRTYGNNLPPRSIPTTNPAMYSSNPIKDMSSRYGNSNPHFRSSPSGDSYSSGQSNYYQPPTRAPSYGNGFPSGGIPIPPTVGIDQGKRPIVPPIPLQGLNGPGSNSYSNGMPSPHDGGNWSQRSNNGMWPSNAEATFVDRYGNNHGSSSLPNTARSDFNPANSIAANNYYARSSKMGESNVSPMLSARSAESEAFGDYFSNNAQPTYRNSNPTSANTSFYSNNTEGFGFDASNVQSYSARSVQSIPQVMSARSNYSSHGNSFREPISGGSSGRGSGAWDINESVAAKPWPAGNNFDLREESPKSSMNLNNTAPSTNESLYDNLSPQSWLTYGNATSQAVGGGSNNGKFWSATSDFSVLDGEENKSRVILGSANGGALDSLSYHNSAAPNNGANSNANNQATINSNRYY